MDIFRFQSTPNSDGLILTGWNCFLSGIVQYTVTTQKSWWFNRCAPHQSYRVATSQCNCTSHDTLYCPMTNASGRGGGNSCSALLEILFCSNLPDYRATMVNSPQFCSTCYQLPIPWHVPRLQHTRQYDLAMMEIYHASSQNRQTNHNSWFSWYVCIISITDNHWLVPASEHI